MDELPPLEEAALAAIKQVFKCSSSAVDRIAALENLHDEIDARIYALREEIERRAEEVE